MLKIIISQTHKIKLEMRKLQISLKTVSHLDRTLKIKNPIQQQSLIIKVVFKYMNWHIIFTQYITNFI